MSEELPEWKQERLASFIQWLEDLPEDEPESSDEVSIDLYTLAEELTALKQEMRTLGRTTSQWVASSETASKALKDELPRLLKTQVYSSNAVSREMLAQARREASRPFLIELGDLSVSFGELVARRSKIKWPFYMSKKARERLQQEQMKPLDVLATRLKALLNRHAITPLAIVGAPFDATKMNAAGMECTGAVSPGCVSSVVRQGFICGEDVLRFAEVIIEENKE